METGNSNGEQRGSVLFEIVLIFSLTLSNTFFFFSIQHYFCIYIIFAKFINFEGSLIIQVARVSIEYFAPKKRTTHFGNRKTLIRAPVAIWNSFIFLPYTFQHFLEIAMYITWKLKRLKVLICISISGYETDRNVFWRAYDQQKMKWGIRKRKKCGWGVLATLLSVSFLFP